MFGQNQIVGKKFFANPPADSLFVTSIFYTLQGEGPLMGEPAVFLRLAKCNLACSFCDTYFDHGEWMTYEEIDDEINRLLYVHWEGYGMDPPDWAMRPINDVMWPFDHPGINLVITGGEPALQSLPLAGFINARSDQWKYVQIESNGTLLLNEDIVDNALVVISPKCAEVDGKATHYLKPSADVLASAGALKFVVSADLTSPYCTVPDWALEWAMVNPLDVFVSPMNVYQDQPREMKVAVMKDGIPSLDIRSSVLEKVSFWEMGLLNMEANRANHEYAARYAMLNGLRLNLQIHLYASIA